MLLLPQQWLVTMDVGHVARSYTVPGQYVHVCVPGQAATMLALASPPSVDSPVVEFLVKSSNQGSAKALCGAVPGARRVARVGNGASEAMHDSAPLGGQAPLRGSFSSQRAGTKVLVSEAQGAGFPMHTIPSAKYPMLYIFATGTGTSEHSSSRA